MDSVMKNGSAVLNIEMTDLDGQKHKLADYKGKVVALLFWSAECPWSSRADDTLKPMLDSWGGEVMVLTIASNANETLEEIRQAAAERGISTLILDQQQEIAQTLEAKITPEVYVFDREGVLRYKGAFDDANFRQPEPTCNYLWEAVEAVLIGERPVPSVTNAYGCTIVFDMGN